MIKKSLYVSFLILLFSSFLITAQAHPGRTDSDGGHNDNINGGYHYHHGEPAHQHYDGVCPYDVDERASSSSLDDEDREFFKNASYVCLGLFVLGIGNRIRWEIKERRKQKTLPQMIYDEKTKKITLFLKNFKKK